MLDFLTKFKILKKYAKFIYAAIFYAKNNCYAKMSILQNYGVKTFLALTKFLPYKNFWPKKMFLVKKILAQNIFERKKIWRKIILGIFLA